MDALPPSRLLLPFLLAALPPRPCTINNTQKELKVPAGAVGTDSNTEQPASPVSLGNSKQRTHAVAQRLALMVGWLVMFVHFIHSFVLPFIRWAVGIDGVCRRRRPADRQPQMNEPADRPTSQPAICPFIFSNNSSITSRRQQAAFLPFVPPFLSPPNCPQCTSFPPTPSSTPFIHSFIHSNHFGGSRGQKQKTEWCCSRRWRHSTNRPRRHFTSLSLCARPLKLKGFGSVAGKNSGMNG